jgi:predicted RNase H-like nuclease (RuvC/YqgF family)
VQPKYALVISRNGNVESEQAVSQHRLIKLVHRHQPDILAVDSVQEIAPHTQDLYRFLEQLPSQTKFIVVTGGDRQVALSRLLRGTTSPLIGLIPLPRHGLWLKWHFMGLVHRLLPLKKRPRLQLLVIVPQAKVGGAKTDMLVRYMECLTVCREIEQELQNKGLSYWKKEYKAFGGVSRVTFHVREDRDKIPVSSSRGR